MKPSALFLLLLIGTQGAALAVDNRVLDEQIRQIVYAADPIEAAAKEGVTQSPQAASDAMQTLLNRYHAASGHGDVEAAYLLAVTYRYGLGVAVDKTESLRQYKLAAERGHPAGATDLALLYSAGDGVIVPINDWFDRTFRRDDAEAVRLLRQATTLGYARAQYYLAHHYTDGRGVAKDHQEGLRLLHRAAEQGFAPAMYALAVQYETVDDAKMLEWLHQAAARGHRVSHDALDRRARDGNLTAIKLMAGLYESGQAVKQDMSVAAIYWQSAAKLGDAESWFRLGLLAERGLPLPETDLQYFRQATRMRYEPALNRIHARMNGGDGSARHLLAEMYLAGDGVESSRGYAIRLLQLGAKTSHSPSLQRLTELANAGEPGLSLFLAYLYEYGVGTSASMPVAISWWRKSADQGAAQGRYRLAKLLEEGRGLPANLPEAIQMYLDVFRQGNPIALEPLDRLAKAGNSLAQKALGDALAEGFDPDRIRAATYLHEVAQDDTLSEIAERLGMGLSVLIEANPQIGNPDRIYKGSLLWLPLSKTSFHPRVSLQYPLDTNGRGPIDAAIHWWKKAADQGLLDARFVLARQYERQGDVNDAIEWYLPAARQRHPQSVDRIKALALSGNPVAILQMCELTQEGILQGNPLSCWIEAQGRGISGALKPIESMAKTGDSEARYVFGKALLEGTQAKADRSQGTHWLTLASEQGHDRATLLLAEQQLVQGGAPLAAAQLLHKAASQGNPQAVGKLEQLVNQQFLPAILELARMRLNGHGTALDTKGGWALMERAAHLGDNGAAEETAVYLESIGKSELSLNMFFLAARRGSDTAKAHLLKRAREGSSEAAGLFSKLLRAHASPHELTQWLTEQAERGDASAAMDLADRLMRGEGVATNPLIAMKWLRQAADADHTAAQLRLARLMENPPFPMQADIGEATKWYVRLTIKGETDAVAALQRLAEGSQPAKALLGLAQFHAAHDQQSEASRYFLKAAEHGEVSAMREVAQRYDEGIGLIKDQETALNWRIKAADANDPTAQIEAAIAYHDGVLRPKNLNEWRRRLEQAAQQGVPVAQYWLGQAYFKGEGVYSNEQTAIEWTEKAARQGEVNAQMWLGQFHFDKHNFSAALPWLTQAATGKQAKAFEILGQMYENGWGTTTNLEQAVKHYSEAADKGQALARYRLGMMLLEGTHLGKDVDKGVTLVEAAAKDGIVDAQFAMARIHFDAEFSRRDDAAAVSWLGKAALSGHMPAQQQLAEAQYHGYETGLDSQGAFELTQCLATTTSIPKRNRLDAWHLLARMLADGHGTQPNKIQAHCGYNLVAADGAEAAASARKALEKDMDSSEILAAERCAREHLKTLVNPTASAGISPCQIHQREPSNVPAPAPTATNNPAPLPQLILPIENSHFYVDIRLGNGDPVEFMIDNGATSLTLSESTLESSGAVYQVINPDASAVLADNKTITGKHVLIDRIRLADIPLDNVRAFVCVSCKPLAGHSVLRRFDTQTRLIDGSEHMILQPRW